MHGRTNDVASKSYLLSLTFNITNVSLLMRSRSEACQDKCLPAVIRVIRTVHKYVKVNGSILKASVVKMIPNYGRCLSLTVDDAPREVIH
ncbi:unnamed protein product [Thelazia callipaeda]|uniref:DUF5641 domain-containing protein n=1 Tax=Thelazia callipaeda TaxID=103827 RepID=A0A0N5CVF0_THECL|nr:unnamed protein product [Thelazia callipaeda]